MTQLTLNVASTVFIGHEPGTDSDPATKVNPGLYHYNTRRWHEHPPVGTAV